MLEATVQLKEFILLHWPSFDAFFCAIRFVVFFLRIRRYVQRFLVAFGRRGSLQWANQEVKTAPSAIEMTGQKFDSLACGYLKDLAGDEYRQCPHKTNPNEHGYRPHLCRWE